MAEEIITTKNEYEMKFHMARKNVRTCLKLLMFCIISSVLGFILMSGFFGQSLDNFNLWFYAGIILLVVGGCLLLAINIMFIFFVVIRCWLACANECDKKGNENFEKPRSKFRWAFWLIMSNIMLGIISEGMVDVSFFALVINLISISIAITMFCLVYSGFKEAKKLKWTK